MSLTVKRRLFLGAAFFGAVISCAKIAEDRPPVSSSRVSMIAGSGPVETIVPQEFQNLPRGYADISGQCPYREPDPGEIVMSEIFANPLYHLHGEFIEIFNRSAETLCLRFIRIHINDILSAEIKYTENIAPGEYRVLCAEPDATRNGGLKDCLALINNKITLKNNGGKIEIAKDDETILDQVSYGQTIQGKSLELSAQHLTTAQNDEPAYWGYASPSEPMGTEQTSAGAANEFLYRTPAELMITEAETEIPGDDYVELYVTKQGSLQGLFLWEQNKRAFAFDSREVRQGQYILVHLNGDGQTSQYNDEQTIDECNLSACPQFAWDFFSTDPGLAATDGFILLTNAHGVILDALLYANGDGVWTGAILPDSLYASHEWFFSGGAATENQAFYSDQTVPGSIQVISASTGAANNSAASWIRQENTPGFGRLSQIAKVALNQCLYRPGSPLVIQVSDTDANRDSNAIEKARVQLKSSTDAGVAIDLEETSADSGVFDNAAQPLYFCPGPNCNVPISLSPGDRIDAVYRDLDPAVESGDSALWQSTNGNTVCNPSFEIISDGFPQDWEIKTPGNIVLAQKIATPGLAAYFETLTTSVSGRELLSGCFSVDASRSMKISGTFMTPDPPEASRAAFKLFLFTDAACNVPALTSFITQNSSSLAASSDWELRSFNVPFTAWPSDVRFARIGIRAAYTSAVGWPGILLYFDDISAEQY